MTTPLNIYIEQLTKMSNSLLLSAKYAMQGLGARNQPNFQVNQVFKWVIQQIY